VLSPQDVALPDRGEERRREARIIERVSKRRATGAGTDRDAVNVRAAVGEVDLEQGEGPVRLGNDRVVAGTHGSDAPGLGAEPALRRQHLGERGRRPGEEVPSGPRARPARRDASLTAHGAASR
jgi:hypothetical protein